MMEKLVFTKPRASADERTHKILLDQDTYMKVIGVAERTDLPIWKVLREMVSYAAKNTEVRREGHKEQEEAKEMTNAERVLWSVEYGGSKQLRDIIERRKNTLPASSIKVIERLADCAERNSESARFTMRLTAAAYIGVADLSKKMNKPFSEVASYLVTYALANLEVMKNAN